MTFRDRIQPQLRDWYDASAGFDFEHLEEFVPKCNAAELANLREDPQVKIRVYAPSQREKAPLPCLFFYHGGGFLFGTVYRQEDLCQRYVKHVGCVVVSVEYRLAPQWKMPAPLEDCYAALLWVWTNHHPGGGPGPSGGGRPVGGGQPGRRRGAAGPGPEGTQTLPAGSPLWGAGLPAGDPLFPGDHRPEGLVPGQLPDLLGQGAQPRAHAHPV